MRTRDLVVLVPFGALAVLVACSSSSNSTVPAADSGTPVMPADEAGTEGGGASGPTAAAVKTIDDAICDLLARCTPLDVQRDYGDVATCKKRNAASEVPFPPAMGEVYTEAEASACAAAFAALPCSTLTGASTPPACQRKGTLAEGAPCTARSQCATGFCYVEVRGEDDCGVCQKPVPVGGDCSSGPCDYDLLCVKNLCTKPRAIGEECNNTTLPCASLIQCLDGKCVAEQPSGASCGASTQAQCDSTKSLVCLPTAPPATDGTCGPWPVAALGKPCGDDTATLQTTICTNSACTAPVGSGAKGTCAPYLADGTACDPTDAVGCQPPALCRSGKCVLARDPARCK